jgi:hypothetical protein
MGPEGEGYTPPEVVEKQQERLPEGPPPVEEQLNEAFPGEGMSRREFLKYMLSLAGLGIVGNDAYGDRHVKPVELPESINYQYLFDEYGKHIHPELTYDQFQYLLKSALVLPYGFNKTPPEQLKHEKRQEDFIQVIYGIATKMDIPPLLLLAAMAEIANRTFNNSPQEVGKETRQSNLQELLATIHQDYDIAIPTFFRTLSKIKIPTPKRTLYPFSGLQHAYIADRTSNKGQISIGYLDAEAGLRANAAELMEKILEGQEIKTMMAQYEEMRNIMTKLQEARRQYLAKALNMIDKMLDEGTYDNFFPRLYQPDQKSDPWKIIKPESQKYNPFSSIYWVKYYENNQDQDEAIKETKRHWQSRFDQIKEGLSDKEAKRRIALEISWDMRGHYYFYGYLGAEGNELKKQYYKQYQAVNGAALRAAEKTNQMEYKLGLEGNMAFQSLMVAAIIKMRLQAAKDLHIITDINPGNLSDIYDLILVWGAQRDGSNLDTGLHALLQQDPIYQEPIKVDALIEQHSDGFADIHPPIPTHATLALLSEQREKNKGPLYKIFDPHAQTTRQMKNIIYGFHPTSNSGYVALVKRLRELSSKQN